MSESGIFKAAVKLAPDRRPAFLDEACGANRELRREVESLLRAHDASGSFLHDRAARRQGTVDHLPIAERPGTVIGPYKLMEQIGEGGMGLVFVAEQQHPVRRKVALKIIKPGLDSKQVVARFEAERQALAMMDHQNIAKVHDAGTTESGRPYFVMELVHGVPITEYCDANKLTPRQRLELFVPVCQAIQHAHQKGIIHRDVKPSNVLVTMYDDKPVPKVIDFGVAKAVEQRLTEKTVYTQFGAMVGTFEYMSPEQAELNAFGVDTRSDVYALGVLLYELLTGTTPLERPRLREAAYGEIVRLIKEEEPPRPSVRLSTSGALAKVAAARKTDPAKLSRLVRGELDWVVMRCLEKDRSRRYDSASGLARDVERYLKDEPVEARPPSAWYRFRKLARRNKVTLTTTALVAASLVLGAGASVWQAVRATLATQAARDAAEQARANEQRATNEEQKARQSEAEARAVLQFFQDKVLAAARPEGKAGGLGSNTTIRAAVDAAESHVAASFADQPLVEASVRDSLGMTYLYLGEPATASRQHARALDLRKAHLGPDDPRTLTSMMNLGVAYQSAERRADAIPLYEETLKRRRSRLGHDHPDTLASMSTLGNAYRLAGRLSEALPLLEETVKLGTAKLGPNHPRVHGMLNLAAAYQNTGRLAEALPLLEELVKQKKDQAMHLLAMIYQDQGDFARAEPLLAEALALQQKTLGTDHPQTADTMALLGRNHLKQQKYAEAEVLLRESLAIQEKKAPGTARLANAQSLLGQALAGQKKFAEAEPLMLAGWEGQKSREKGLNRFGRTFLTEAVEGLVRLYGDWGRPDEAAEWRKQLEAMKTSKQSDTPNEK